MTDRTNHEGEGPVPPTLAAKMTARASVSRRGEPSPRVENTDFELWREHGGHEAATLHVTPCGGIGINVGGTVVVKPLREWHRLASPSPTAGDEGRETAVTFWYKNYQGEEGYRRVIPISIRFGESNWHPEKQWLMLADDTVNNKRREFAMRDISSVIGSPVIAIASLPAAPADGVVTELTFARDVLREVAASRRATGPIATKAQAAAHRISYFLFRLQDNQAELHRPQSGEK